MCVLWHNNVVGVVCPGGYRQINSKCYIMNNQQLTWYSASNQCLSQRGGGSLAVFSNTGSPSDNTQLTSWLNASGIDKSYWIGLVRSWWKTTDESNFNHFFRILVAWSKTVYGMQKVSQLFFYS